MSNGIINGKLSNYSGITGTVTARSQMSGNIMATVLKGLSAYDVAVQEGFSGTVEEWLESLVGNGIESVEMDDDGFLILHFTDETDYKTPISLKPKNGHSPYIGGNGDWYIYDDNKDEYIDSGYTSIIIIGDGLVSDPVTGEISVDSTDELIKDSKKLITSGGVYEKLKNMLSGKVDKVDGKGLSTNDYTSDEKTKLANVAAGAQVNVLEGIQKNGTNVTVTNKIANITVPTATSDLTNDSGFITIADIPKGAAASTTVPKADGTANPGSELAFARGDHVHPTDTSRASASDVSALTDRVGDLETAVGIGGSVDSKISTAIQDLDSSIAATSNQAISSVTITDGKITGSTKVTVPTNTNQLTNGAGFQTANDVSTAIADALDPFIVTITSTTSNGTTTYSADKTFTEITAAYNAGKICIAKNSTFTCYLSFIGSSTIRFINVVISTTANIQIQSGTAFEINSSNTVTRINKYWYSTSSIKDICVEKKAIGKVNGTYSWVTGTGTFSETAYQNYSEGDLFWRTNTELVKAITDISSDDTLTENTNYVVTTIDNELKLKPDFNDVLTKMNTTSYTPTSDYNPATKKYVDDNIGRAGILVVNITDGEEEGTYESDKTFVEISEAITEGKDIKCIYWNNIYHLVYNNNDGFLQFQNRINIDVDDPQYSDINDIYFNVIQIDIFNNTIDVFQDRCEVPLPSITTPLMNGTSSIGNSKKYAKADHMHPTDTTRAAVNDVLIKTNTTSYTPTADYHPATKKYVDDATANITTNLSGLTDTTITTPTDGQLLRYNSTTSKWENVTLSLAISGNTIQLKEGNTVISSVTLPTYNGGVSS